MNDVTNPILTLLKRQMDDLNRSISMLHTDTRAQAKPSKIGTLMRLEALGREAILVRATLDQLTDVFQAKAVAK